MKKIITLLSILFLFSCNEQNNVKENKTEIQKFTKFETFLNHFYNQNINWSNNQKTITETSKIFKKELIEFFKNNDSVFYDHPLQLNRTSKDGNLGLFRIWGTDKIKFKGIDPIDQESWYVDVVMEIPKSQIDTLVEKNYYRIIGKFNRYIKENDEYYSLSSYTFEPKLSKGSFSSIDGNLIFNIGCINIKPIKIETIYGSETNGDYYYLRIHDKNKE
jgi:hypothetical protein